MDGVVKTQFGAYGKIPAKGDFIKISLPAGFVQPWDDWLSATMISCREMEGWDRLYLSAPIWRFTLAAGIAGPSALLGVLMPSVDAVGRRFPLTLVSPFKGSHVLAAHMAGPHVFAALETLALATLDDSAELDDLKAGLGHLSLPDTRVIEFVDPGGSIWSADLNHGTRILSCRGLPDEKQRRALFDPTDPCWATTQ